MDINLNKEQISKLIVVYEKFKDLKDFSASLEKDNIVCIKFDINELVKSTIEVDKSFVVQKY